MTHRRPYRPAVSVDIAIEELRRGSGTQFDPGVIEPFCAVMSGSVDRYAIGA